MPDKFGLTSTGLESPAANFFDVTPSAAELDQPTRAIYVSVSGDVTGEDMDGNSVTFANMSEGQIYPLRFLKITAATATVIGLY